MEGSEVKDYGNDTPNPEVVYLNLSYIRKCVIINIVKQILT